MDSSKSLEKNRESFERDNYDVFELEATNVGKVIIHFSEILDL